MLFADGDYFIGYWHEGYVHGKGEYISLTGCSYNGEWINSLYDGYGEELLADGSIYKGMFSKGK